MIAFCFYIWSILAILFELWSVYDTNHDKTVKLTTKIKNNKESNITKSETIFMTLIYLYFVWSLVGLFTSQWVLFAALIIFSFISSFVKKHFKFLTYWYVVDSLVSLSILFFIIINKYHLHINLFREMFLN